MDLHKLCNKFPGKHIVGTLLTLTADVNLYTPLTPMHLSSMTENISVVRFSCMIDLLPAV